jgi:8-amino-7-oxononanoate synthase
MIEPEPLQQVDRTRVRFQGAKLDYFSGCDYFRLSSHPKILSAVRSGLERYGLNVAASRMTTGNHALYGRLEERLADFFDAPTATCVPTGYLSNLIVAQALAGNFSHALIDEASHPSLQDAARFLDCPVLKFAHRDANDLASAVSRCGPQASVIVLTDGMFSHDGSAAPLAEYQNVLPGDAWLMVDDAHGAGVLGATGRGTPELAEVKKEQLIQNITLSKAFGTYGGAILAPKQVRLAILERSHLFVGSTPLPLPLVSAALQAVELLSKGKRLRRRLKQNHLLVRTSLRTAGFALPRHPGPIVALLPKGRQAAIRAKSALKKAGIYPPFVNYPGGPAAGYFRFAISSEHTSAQISNLVQTLLGLDGSLAAAQEPD